MELTLETLTAAANDLSKVLALDPVINTTFEIPQVTAKGAAGKAQLKKIQPQIDAATESITKEIFGWCSDQDGEGNHFVLATDMPNLTADTQAVILSVCPDQKDRLFPEGDAAPAASTEGKKRPGRPKGTSTPKESKPKQPKKTSRGTLMTKVFLDGVTEREAALAAGDKAAVEAGWASNASEAGFQYNKVKEIFAAIEQYGYKVVKA